MKEEFNEYRRYYDSKIIAQFRKTPRGTVEDYITTINGKVYHEVVMNGEVIETNLIFNL